MTDSASELGGSATVMSLMRSNRWLFTFCLIAGLGGGIALASAATKNVASTVQVSVDATLENRTAGVRLQQLVNLDTEAVVVRSDRVLDEFERKLGSTRSRKALRSRIVVTAVPGSFVLNIKYEDSTASAAAIGAKALAEIYLEQRRNDSASAIDDELAQLVQQIEKQNQRIASIAKRLGPLRPNGTGAGSGDGAAVDRARLNTEALAAKDELVKLEIRQGQLQRTVVTPGSIVTAPSAAKSTAPPSSVTILAGGLVGLMLGSVAAAARRRRTDSAPTNLLARRLSSGLIVQVDAGSGGERLLLAVKPRLGDLVAVGAVAPASAEFGAKAFAVASAKSGNPTILVLAVSEESVAAPTTSWAIADATNAADDCPGLSILRVAADDPALAGHAFFALLRRHVSETLQVVVVGAGEPLQDAPVSAAFDFCDHVVVLVTPQTSRSQARKVSVISGLRADVIGLQRG